MGDQKSGEASTSSGASGSNSFAMSTVSTDIHGISCFNPTGDATNLSARWKRWKRAFNLYLVAKGVTNEQQSCVTFTYRRTGIAGVVFFFNWRRRG